MEVNPSLMIALLNRQRLSAFRCSERSNFIGSYKGIDWRVISTNQTFSVVEYTVDGKLIGVKEVTNVVDGEPSWLLIELKLIFLKTDIEHNALHN